MTCSQRHERGWQENSTSFRNSARFSNFVLQTSLYLEKRRCSDNSRETMTSGDAPRADECPELETLSTSTGLLARPWAANRNTTIIRQMNEIEWTDRPTGRPARTPAYACNRPSRAEPSRLENAPRAWISWMASAYSLKRTASSALRPNCVCVCVCVS